MTENIHSMKERALKVADWLLTQKPSRYRDIGVQALRNWDAAVKILEEIEDVVGQPGMPCPVQSQTAISRLRHVFGIPVKRHAKVKHVPAQMSAVTYCGPGPYCAKIVRSDNIDSTVWVGPHVYKTEDDAVRAVLRKAVREANLTHRWTVDKDCVRHWVTKRKEHVIDFGSHAYYGVVTGKETK